MSAVTHLASALISPVGDFILQLVGEDVPDGLLVAIFEEGGDWVGHVQSGLLFVFADLQLEVRSVYFSCGETGGSVCMSVISTIVFHRMEPYYL